MKMKKLVALVAVCTLALAGCGSKDNKEAAKSEEISGTITVVTDRTDADEIYAQIEKDFIKEHPEVEDIKWEASADYDQYMTTRMNTKDYGDVLLVPFSMAATPEEYPNYFESLGKVADLEKDYLDPTEADYEGEAYGLPVALNSLGIIYNEAVLKEAGIEKMPTTMKEMEEAFKKIKDNTDAIPFYTNYNATLSVWAGALTSFGGEQYKSDTLSKGTAFEKGQPIREVMDFFYMISSKGYTEEDPVTGDMGKAQQLLAEGKVAMLMFGSQQVPAIQKMSKDTISIAPFPVKQDGETVIPFGAPGVMGVNVNSKNKATAKAFLDFFISAKSGYADSLAGISPKKVDWTAEQKQTFSENKIILTVPTEEVADEALYNTIAQQVGVGRLGDVLQKTINIGLYPEQNESYDAYLKELEASWKQAVQENE